MWALYLGFLCWIHTNRPLCVTVCCFTVPEASLLQNRFLHLNELAVEEIIWVDEVDGLRNATCHIEGCKVLGLDCEWKPNYEKGIKPNKVISLIFYFSLSLGFCTVSLISIYMLSWYDFIRKKKKKVHIFEKSWSYYIGSLFTYPCILHFKITEVVLCTYRFSY